MDSNTDEGKVVDSQKENSLLKELGPTPAVHDQSELKKALAIGRRKSRLLENVLTIGEKEIWEMTIEEQIEEEEHLHGHMAEEFIFVSKELDFILDVSSIAFVFPIMLLGRYIGAQKTGRSFQMTVADYFDLIIFGLVVWAWQVVENYRNTPLKIALFGPEKDTIRSIQFLTNVMDDSMDDVFHLDYLMAAITALLWYRANL